MKSAILGALLAAVVACGGGSGGDDQSTPDAALDPHSLVDCQMGSATRCANACNPAPAATGTPCSAEDGQYSGTCSATFLDSEGKPGCCQVLMQSAGGYALRFLQCV